MGHLLRSLLQNPRNFSEVAPEVRPAMHTAPLCLAYALKAQSGRERERERETDAVRFCRTLFNMEHGKQGDPA